MRRVHLKSLEPGKLPIDPSDAHHLLRVLRLKDGAEIEAFDDAGRVARGILRVDGDRAIVEVDRVDPIDENAPALTIASAVPKGDRADWMIEKLSELGVDRFIPLATKRSVVLPAGKNKTERWERIANESAKQSKRRGTMKIDMLTELRDAIRVGGSSGVYLSTQPNIAPLQSEVANHKSQILFIGPEGGWTDDEIEAFEKAGLTPVGLTATILRVETAAVAAAAIVASSLASGRREHRT